MRLQDVINTLQYNQPENWHYAIQFVTEGTQLDTQKRRTVLGTHFYPLHSQWNSTELSVSYSFT